MKIKGFVKSRQEAIIRNLHQLEGKVSIIFNELCQSKNQEKRGAHEIADA